MEKIGEEWGYEMETEDLHSVDLRNFIFPFYSNTKAFIALVFLFYGGVTIVKVQKDSR